MTAVQFPAGAAFSPHHRV